MTPGGSSKGNGRCSARAARISLPSPVATRIATAPALIPSVPAGNREAVSDRDGDNLLDGMLQSAPS